MSVSLPVYFERIIASFHRGNKNRCAHLGHWDLSAPEFSRTDDSVPMSSEEFHAAQQRLDEQMLQRAGLADDQAILDVGCGLGGLIERINAGWSRMQLTGLNVDPEQLEICHRIRAQRDNILRWQEGDACHLPFDDSTFDCVFCVEAMFHFSSRRQFLREVLRVLKPGGRLVGSDIVLLAAPAENQLPRFAVAAMLNDGYGPWPDPWCDQGSIASLCADSGFRDLNLVDATRSTLPSYNSIVPRRFDDAQDPGDAATRSAMMLRWLHRSGGLRYEYFSAIRNP